MGFMVDPSVIKYEATPESAEGIYEWGQKRATHIFCKNCGSLLMTKLKKLESMGPVGGKVNINVSYFSFLFPPFLFPQVLLKICEGSDKRKVD
jgi:hypothetical protein